MRHYNYLWMLAVILLSHSCEQQPVEPEYKGPTTAKGKITDATTNNGVPYATALLTRNRSSSGMGREIVEQQEADKDGNFSFSFTPDADYSYRVEGEAQHYFISGGDGAAFLHNNAENKNLTVKIKPKGYIKFVFINEEPNQTVDFMCSGSFSQSIEIHGFSRDTIIYRSVIGNQTSYIHVNKYENGIKKLDSKEIYCPTLDTIEYLIKY